jgi:NAD(P)-dependent dehydrogenase (short-subunit alcohol dehydrogenase family)
VTPPVRYPVSEARYAGRRALITGGAGGIGYATAARLAAEGATVALLDLDKDKVEEAADRLRDSGRDVSGYCTDVTDVDGVRDVVASLHARAGSLDVLVTVAGIYPWTEFADMTLPLLKQVLDVNLGGTFVCSHAVMPVMKQQGYGRIVTVSSETTLIGAPQQSAYIASKAGVVGLTRAPAREGGPYGVTANSVLPGLIDTEHLRAQHDGARELFAAVVPMQSVQRPGTPDDVADAIAYLASEGAEFVTGQSLIVGGGDRSQ